MTKSKFLRGIVDLPKKASRFPQPLSEMFKRKLMKFILKFAVPGKKPSLIKSRNNFVVSQLCGRCIRTVPVSNITLLEPLPTIKSAILGGSKLPLIPIQKRFWRRCIRMARPKVTAMLIVDSSRSSREYLSKLSDVLKTLFEEFTDPASRIGMVAIEDGKAKLIFSPTKNRLRVFGKMKQLVPGGYTPLGEALKIARTELTRFKLNDSSVKPFVIFVSDCYPEPLPDNIVDAYESKLYKIVRHEAELFRLKNIPIALIDPSSSNKNIAERMPGRRLARFIVSRTRGVFISMPAISISIGGPVTPKFVSEEIKKTKAYEIAKQLDNMSKIVSNYS